MMHERCSGWTWGAYLPTLLAGWTLLLCLLPGAAMAQGGGTDQSWFNVDRLNTFVLVLLITGVVLWFVAAATSGKTLFIRKIAGLETVEEAVGRATEMGKPILYIPGIADMDDVQTIASMNLLGHLAEIIANYESKLYVPVRRSLVMSAAKETVHQSYLSAGRPDAYQEDAIYYVSDEQFAYVAAVDGILLREKPAACFYLGSFYAESLILAETGNAVGAMQIAGTANPPQLPFFVAACDYTLLGEELFAASAYLSKDPRMLGSLKGQDVGKAIAIVFIVVGCGLKTLESLTGSETVRQISDVALWLFK